MVIVSERSIERMLREVAPKVERLTGWDTKLDDLNVKIINRNQLWDQDIQPKYDSLGIDLVAKTEKLEESSKKTEWFLPYVVFGLYEPFSETMFVLPDNARFDTNESGLTVILGHELVHRCQFLNNEKYRRLYDSLIRKMTGSNAFDEDAEEDESVVKSLQAYMALAEGDASFVEGQLKKMFYQDAQIKVSRLSEFIGLVLHLGSLGNIDEGSTDKMRQYTEGEKVVGRVYETEGREGVNALYSLDEGGLYQRFG